MNNAFEYLLIKDPHFMFGFRNNIRRSGWEKAIHDKITQIITYALEHNIKNIVFTGDVFEKSYKKDWSFSQLQQNRTALERFKKSDLTVYSNMGNHDYFSGHESIEGTAFGEMRDLGLINYIGSGMPPVIFDIHDKKIGLFGIDYHQNKDIIFDELTRVSQYPNVDYKICTTHSNITDKNVMLTDFTYEQLSVFNIDIINCGHWHLAPTGGSVQCLNNTHFLNPWNLTRVMREYHVKLDEHKPAFIHTTITLNNNQFETSCNEIELKVLPFSEAFNSDVIDLLQELGKDGFKFFEEVTLDQDEDLNKDESLLISLAKSYDISERSIKLAKELLL